MSCLSTQRNDPGQGKIQSPARKSLDYCVSTLNEMEIDHLLLVYRFDFWVHCCVSFCRLVYFIIVDPPKITVRPEAKTKIEGDNVNL